MFAVGADVVEVHGPAATWWIAIDAIAAVESTGPMLGDPADRADTTLIDLATDLVDTAEPVTAMLADGISLHGDVLSAGSSLLLRQQHPDRTVVVALDHLVGIGRRAAHEAPLTARRFRAQAVSAASSSTAAVSSVPGTMRLASMNSATSLSFRRITRPNR